MQRRGKRKAAGRAAFKRKVKARTAARRGRLANTMELKFHDVDLDIATTATAGAITASINIIAQGVTESTRIGRKCTIKAIGWKYDMTMKENVAQGSPPNAETIRVMLYLDKQCNGATATVTGILETADYQSFNNLANKGRFRILMDRTYTLNFQAAIGITATSDWPETLVSDSFYKTCNIPIEYDNTFNTGVITTIRTNNIGVLVISRSALSTFQSKFRLRFADG